MCKNYESTKMIPLWLSCFLCIIPLGLADIPSGYAAGGVVSVVKFGSKDYYFSYNFKANFLQAHQVCKDINMRLVSIPTKEVNDFLYKTISSSRETNFWTSGSNILDGKTWRWMSTAQPISFSNWYPGQPDSSSQRCIIAQLVKGKDLFWNNVDCSKVNSFICESVEPIVARQGTVGSWASVFADPSVSPNFPIYNYNRNNYLVVSKTSMSYLDAGRFCEMIDMELVSIESAAENIFLYRTLGNLNLGTRFWTGGNSLINGIDWVWLPSGRKVIYTNWGKGQPDSKNELCIEVVLDKGNGLFWNNAACSRELSFICKAPTEQYDRCPVIDPACHENPRVRSVVSQTRRAPHQEPIFTYQILTKEQVTYSDAVKACKDLSMSLVSIQSQEKSDAINKVILDSSTTAKYWTSGTKDKVKNSFFWITGEPVVFTNWIKGDVSNLQRADCIALVKSGISPKWNDSPCDYKYYPICEKLVEDCCGRCNVNVFVDKDGVVY